MSLEVIILAAGQGTRMRSALPKVLHQMGGKSMLHHVIKTAMQLDPRGIHVVTGYGSEQVREHISGLADIDSDKINWCFQAEQNGTGHAVAQAIPAVDTESNCLILFGDVPLVDEDSLRNLCNSKACLAVLTATPERTDGLGRILRDQTGAISGIVEQKDATSQQLNIGEINTGIMRCPAAPLGHWLKNLSNDNNQGEYYLTDIVASAVADGKSVHGEIAGDPDLFLGVNSRMDLATVERKFQQLQAQRLMNNGVTLCDPARIDIRGEVTFGIDCSIDVNAAARAGRIDGNRSKTIRIPRATRRIS